MPEIYTSIRGQYFCRDNYSQARKKWQPAKRNSFGSERLLASAIQVSTLYSPGVCVNSKRRSLYVAVGGDGEAVTWVVGSFRKQQQLAQLFHYGAGLL